MNLADMVPEEEDCEALVGLIPESGNHVKVQRMQDTERCPERFLMQILCSHYK